MTTPFIRWFSDIGIADFPQVGGKNASLGEMVRELGAQGVRVPNGFAVTAGAYSHLLDQSRAWGALHEALDGLDVKDVDDRQGARAVRGKSSTARCCRPAWSRKSMRPMPACAPNTANR